MEGMLVESVIEGDQFSAGTKIKIRPYNMGSMVVIRLQSQYLSILKKIDKRGLEYHKEDNSFQTMIRIFLGMRPIEAESLMHELLDSVLGKYRTTWTFGERQGPQVTLDTASGVYIIKALDDVAAVLLRQQLLRKYPPLTDAIEVSGANLKVTPAKDRDDTSELLATLVTHLVNG